MIQNGVLNCGVGAVGTWFDGCKNTPKEYVKVFLLSPLVNIDLTSDTFTAEDRGLLIKKGWLVPLNDILQVTEAGAKTNIQTLPNKREIFVSSGLLKFTAEMEANICLVKSLHTLSKKKWQIILLDSEGKFFFDSKGGKLNGFEVQSFVVDNETTNDGGSKVATVSVSMQLTQNGTKGFNERRSFLLSDEYYDVVGIQDVILTSVSLVHTTLKVQVLGGCDKSTPITGLSTENFRVLDAGTGEAEEIGVTDNGDGTYDIAGAAAGDVVIQLYDSVLNLPVADIENTQFYQSNPLVETLT